MSLWISCGQEASAVRDGIVAELERARRALETTIREGTTVTRDLGGTASTDQFTEALIAKL